MIPTINSWELEEANQNNKLYDLFIKDENFKILMNCMGDDFEVSGDFKFKTSENPEQQRMTGIKACVYGILDDPELNGVWTRKMMEEYCECAY